MRWLLVEIIYFRCREGGTEGLIRKRERASPRFWMKASELKTSFSGRVEPTGAMGSTSSSWNSRATSSTVFGSMGR